MRICLMCQTEKDDVAALKVAPAIWNGFNDFAEVCAGCRETPRFKAAARAAAVKARSRTAPVVDTAAQETSAQKVEVRISHRRTGELLLTVEAGSLAGAALSGAALSGAALQHAGLRRADLHQADLHLADLAGADLRGADLRAANLRGADLCGADLSDARLQRADFRHCLYDARTRWPADFDPRTSGAMKGALGR